jgi:hypothetical protein
MKRIIGIGGLVGSGKDTYAMALRQVIRHHSRGIVETIAMADPRTLRAATAAAFQVPMEAFNHRVMKDTVDPAWGISPRDMLRVVGEYMRTYDPDHWVKVWVRLVAQSPATYIIVPDVRRKNEIDGIHELGGVVVCMVREGVKFDGHETERIAHESLIKLQAGWTEVGRFLRPLQETPFDLFCENYYQARDESQAVSSLEPSALELLNRIEQGRLQ